MTESPITRTIYRWRVRISLFGLILAVILSRAGWVSLICGLGLNLFGLAIRAWATGHLRKEKELTMSGPYRFTRNPLYLANLIIGIGIVVACRSWWILGFFVLYFLIFYPVIIRVERNRLQRLFPEEYEEFSRRVPLFFPVLKSRLNDRSRSFSWGLYQKNHETRALLGAAVFWSILTLRMIVF